MSLDEVLRAGPVLPVITLHDVRHAVALARALLAGGVRTLEVTLRTPDALDAVREIRRAVPHALVGVGTLTSPAQVEAALAAGAQFGVSPGLTPALRDAVKASGMPFLPGVMTPTEALAAREAGFTAVKLFPATQAGGVGMLRALAPVFAGLRFCPTGGITPASAPDFLALPNVACVGGSWLTPQALVDAQDWEAITALARAASALRAGPD